MKTTKLFSILGILTIALLYANCSDDSVKKFREKINYKNFINRFKKDKPTVDKSDTANILDNDNYDPATIDSAELIATIETVYKSDSLLIDKMDADKGLLNKPSDSIQMIAKKDSFTNDIKKVTPGEIAALKINLEQLKNNAQKKPADSTATRNKCAVWADVSRKDQRLYLYVEGALVDSFKVSTGGKGHETPNIDRRPSGPVFRKYTSKKYPGGNYNGLGNMPWVVFVQGGYALHGTTIGNIPKLGKPASHGCVRLHPDNAKIINELAKTVGLENMWVTIRD
jgi:lipoprotein-anchoring transpeptidase ErfK/SrfK